MSEPVPTYKVSSNYSPGLMAAAIWQAVARQIHNHLVAQPADVAMKASVMPAGANMFTVSISDGRAKVECGVHASDFDYLASVIGDLFHRLKQTRITD